MENIVNVENKPPKKPSTALIVLIIIIIISVSSWCGYMVYNRMFKDGYNKNTDNNSGLEDLALSKQVALSIGNEIYPKATDAYWCRFEYEGDEVTEFDEDNILSYYRIITNYNQVASIFTNHEKAEFEAVMKVERLTIEQLNLLKDYSQAGFILINDDKVYGSVSLCARGGDINYQKTILIVKQVSSDIIKFTAKSYYCDSEKWDNKKDVCNDKDTSDTKENEFTIKKDNQQWLIDKFTLPN